jgi:RNA polymerase sigma factor
VFDRSEALFLLAGAREGIPEARDRLIQVAVPFISSVVARYCRKRIDCHSDELSVGMVAFNESIDAFNGPEQSFFPFAQEVIRRRLIDYFRSQRRFEAERPLLDGQEGEPGTSSPEVRAAWQRHWLQQEADERAEEIAILGERLKTYGISFNDLVRSSPSHRDTRERLRRAALRLSQDPGLMEALESKGRLPKKDLCRVAGVSRRVLDRGRNYVIALAVIAATDQYPRIREYLNLEGGPGM